ncbi:MAG: glycosyltransferase [Candidatus Altiarchaeota archaeon]
MVKYSVIIPAYNEDDNLTPLVENLLGVISDDDWEIVIVDDNSSDKTPEICDKLVKSNPRIRCIHRRRGDNGMGYALIEGTRSSRGEYVIWVMADRSDKLDIIGEMVGKLDRGYDMVMASRYMRGGSRGELGTDKAIYGSTYTRLARLIFRIPIHDITNAYRGFQREVFDHAMPEAGDFSISPEFAIKAHMNGYKLGEIPTTYFNRRFGKTKFNLIRMGIRYVSLFALRLTYKSRRR